MWKFQLICFELKRNQWSWHVTICSTNPQSVVELFYSIRTAEWRLHGTPSKCLRRCSPVRDASEVRPAAGGAARARGERGWRRAALARPLRARPSSPRNLSKSPANFVKLVSNFSNIFTNFCMLYSIFQFFFQNLQALAKFCKGFCQHFVNFCKFSENFQK